MFRVFKSLLDDPYPRDGYTTNDSELTCNSSFYNFIKHFQESSRELEGIGAIVMQ